MLRAHAQVYSVATNWGQGSAGFVKYYNPEAAQLQWTIGRHRQYAFLSPKLNRVDKQLLQKEEKQADASLAKLQTFILDAVAPLVYRVEETQKEAMTSQAASAKTALSLLGNACLQGEMKKVILALN